ncbi:MAG: hypothetical protein ABS909_06320, partial [Arthrobacter sp.]
MATARPLLSPSPLKNWQPPSISWFRTPLPQGT